MKKLSGVIAVALMVAACGGSSPAADTTPSTAPTTTTGPPVATTAPPVASNDDGVAVVVTATPVLQEDGTTELCPPGTTGPCPGIALEGEAGDVAIAAEDGPVVVQVTGWYDGARLLAAAEPAVVDFPPLEGVRFDSLCPGMEGSPGTAGGTLTERVTEYAAAQPEFAALWWDTESSVITAWFTGDASAHEEAIAAIAGDEPVCVAGGARFSEADLMEASVLLGGFTDSRGLPLAIRGGYSVGGIHNRIDVPVEEADSATRAALADLVGDRVTLYPFIETLDAPLSELPAPAPAVPGDVDILTDRARPWGGMEALGTFVVRYDPELNCVYFAGEGEDRTVPVWPFGYTATSEPFTVYDFDGVPVASEGDTLELGGGFVDAVDGNTCGAAGAWIINGEPAG